MSSELLDHPYAAPATTAHGASRLIVTWQHPQSRAHEAVGVLDCRDDAHEFRYLRRALTVDGFQPFLGFAELDRAYRSRQLFPLFSQRVMRESRPDYRRHLDALYLPHDAKAWQVLERSQGQREGDEIRVFLEPSIGVDGWSENTFLVHGVRHRLMQDPSGVERALSALRQGEVLQIVPEPDNPADSRAVLVSAISGTALGWVPTVLLDWVAVLLGASDVDARVVHVNNHDGPPGYRLLVRLAGTVPHDWRPFSGPGWEPIS